MADWTAQGNSIFAQNGISGTAGTALSSPGSTNTMGAKTEIIASTAFDSHGILLYGVTESGSGTHKMLVDWYIGAASSEQAIVRGLYTGRVTSTAGGCFLFRAPVFVPAGSRISASVQSNTASPPTTRCAAMLLGASPSLPQPYGLVQPIGPNYTSTAAGQTCTAGTSSAKGSWVELSSSTTSAVDFARIQWAGGSAGSGATYLIDIGIGAGGSEVVLVPDIPFYVGVASGTNQNPIPMVLDLPLSIPAGTRVAARIACSTNSATLDVGLIGFG